MATEIRYTAWRGGNGVWSRWHILQNATYTFCGKRPPLEAQVAGEDRAKREDECRMCRSEYVKNLRIGAS